MRNGFSLLRTAGAALALVLMTGAMASAQQGAVKPAEEVYKNIQVLKGVPSPLVIPTMQFIRDSLGVTCEFCHVDDRAHRELDDRDTKKTARKMIAMVMAINKQNFDGRTTVTCYTCHRGSNEPVLSPVIPSEHPVLMEKEEAPNLPSIDDILAKYTSAMGGEAAIHKVTSRVVTYTLDAPAPPGGAVPPQATVERDMKTPNMVAVISKSSAGNTANGSDGSSAWTQDAKGKVTDLAGGALAAAQRDADFYGGIGLDLNLKQRYARLTPRRIEKVEARDAYVVYGFKQQQNAPPDWLYFDTQTGLLLRLVEFTPTALGNDPTYTDYHDYRNVGGGVKYPFNIARYTMAALTTINTKKVQDNVSVDSSKFSKPAGQ